MDSGTSDRLDLSLATHLFGVVDENGVESGGGGLLEQSHVLGPSPADFVYDMAYLAIPAEQGFDDHGQWSGHVLVKQQPHEAR